MIIEPNCSKRECKFFMGVRWKGDDETTEVPYCAAYPNGIPEDIAYGDSKHLEIRDDQDNNIVYEREPKPENE